MVVENKKEVQFYEHLKNGAIKDIAMDIKPLKLKFEGIEGKANKITLHHAYKLTITTAKEEILINILSSKGVEEFITTVYGVLNDEKAKEINLSGILQELGMTISYKVTALKGGAFLKGDIITYTNRA